MCGHVTQDTIISEVIACWASLVFECVWLMKDDHIHLEMLQSSTPLHVLLFANYPLLFACCISRSKFGVKCPNIKCRSRTDLQYQYPSHSMLQVLLLRPYSALGCLHLLLQSPSRWLRTLSDQEWAPHLWWREDRLFNHLQLDRCHHLQCSVFFRCLLACICA